MHTSRNERSRVPEWAWMWENSIHALALLQIFDQIVLNELTEDVVIWANSPLISTHTERAEKSERCRSVIWILFYAECTAHYTFVHHKNILAMARECSHYVFFSPVKWKKSSRKMYLSYFHSVLFVFQTYIRHFSRFLFAAALWLGQTERTEKRLHWLTYSHILKFIAVRFIFLFCQLPKSFQREKNSLDKFFFSFLIWLNVSNVWQMQQQCGMCVQKLNFCSWTQTKQSEKITHDNQHSVISKYMYSVCSNAEQANEMFVSQRFSRLFLL